MSDKKEYIYVLTLLPVNKKYVGRTVNPDNRLKQHISALKSGRHPNKRMQEDYTRFSCAVSMEVVDTGDSRRQQEINLEKNWISHYQTYDEECGYNDKDFVSMPLRRAMGLPVREGNRKGKKNGYRKAV